MRRGSIQTFESLARRNSSNMAQFASNRTEFMTSDLNDIEYERKGGFFMTHRKTALAVSAVVVIVIAAGFVGAYVGSVPKEKVYDTLALIDGDVGCDQRVVSSKFSLSDAIRPSRYRVDLSPIVEDDPIVKLRGRVTVEFRLNGSSDLGEIVFNARKITVTRMKLVHSITGDLRNSRRRRGDPEDNADGSIARPSQSAAVHENSTISNNDIFGNSTNMENNGDDKNSTTPAIETTDKRDETREIEISRSEADEKAGFIVFYPTSPLKSGFYLFDIAYEVPLDDYSVLANNDTKSNDEMKLTAGRVNRNNILNFFPVFDDARMKAHFSLSVPQFRDATIYSNMPVRNTSDVSSEWSVVSFEETPSISPETLVVTETRNVETLSDEKINNTRVVVMGNRKKPDTAEYLIDMTSPVIDNLVRLFQVDLPIERLNIIAADNIDENSGHLGLVTIRESLYGVNDESPNAMKEEVSMKLVNLIGRQWLGGLVNMQNSSETWVLESSLLYLQHLLKREINPVFNHSTFLVDVQADAMEIDGYSVSRSLRSKLNPTHSNLFYIHEVYAMGACLIRMLHGSLSEPEFRAGYRAFVSRWSGGNADESSFWEAIVSNSSKNERSAIEPNLPEVMKLWSVESGYPVVTITRNYETGSAKVHQARFHYDKLAPPSEQLWHIPLTWISENETVRNLESSIEWLKPEVEATLDLIGKQVDNRSWIIFNPTKSGYFRVNYDADNWKSLARALKDDHRVFLPETRASLVDDVFSLSFVGLVPWSIAFEVIGYMPENEIEPEPWSIILHHSMKLNLALYDSPAYLDYHEYMVKFVSDLWTKVGLKIGQGSRLTGIAHQLACLFDYQDYLTWAQKSYEGFERSPGLPIKIDVPSYLRKNLLCAFAKAQHQLGWQWWQHKFTNVTDREERISLLSSLACFQVPFMLQAVLNDIVYSTSFEESDALVILESFSNYPAASQTALQFIESNWKNITRRYPKSCKITSAFLDASSTGFTSEKDVEDFQSFRDKNYESLKKVGYVTALLEAKANATVSFLQTSLAEFHTLIGNGTVS